MGKGDRKTRKGKRFINSPRKGARHEYTKSGNKNMEQKVEKAKCLWKYIEKLDTSSYGHNDSYKINDELQEVIRKLVDAGLNDIAIKADLDRQVFAVRKSFDYVDDEEQGIAKGLSWQASGIKTLQDGVEALFTGLMLEIIHRKILSILKNVIMKQKSVCKDRIWVNGVLWRKDGFF